MPHEELLPTPAVVHAHQLSPRETAQTPSLHALPQSLTNATQQGHHSTGHPHVLLRTLRLHLLHDQQQEGERAQQVRHSRSLPLRTEQGTGLAEVDQQILKRAFLHGQRLVVKPGLQNERSKRGQGTFEFSSGELVEEVHILREGRGTVEQRRDLYVSVVRKAESWSRRTQRLLRHSSWTSRLAGVNSNRSRLRQTGILSRITFDSGASCEKARFTKPTKSMKSCRPAKIGRARIRALGWKQSSVSLLKAQKMAAAAKVRREAARMRCLPIARSATTLQITYLGKSISFPKAFFWVTAAAIIARELINRKESQKESTTRARVATRAMKVVGQSIRCVGALVAHLSRLQKRTQQMSGCTLRMLAFRTGSLKGRASVVSNSLPTNKATVNSTDPEMSLPIHKSTVTAAMTISRLVSASFCRPKKTRSSSRIDSAPTSRRTPFRRLASSVLSCHSNRCGAGEDRAVGAEAAESVGRTGEEVAGRGDLKSSDRSLISAITNSNEITLFGNQGRAVGSEKNDITIKSNKFQFYSGKMMQRIPFGSPSKENFPASPSRRRKGDLLSELQALLKPAGLVLPPHIAHLLAANPESPNKGRAEEAKRLRVQLSESEFELKKVEEDFAEFKRQAKLEREKETRRSEEQIAKLRTCLETSTENSAYKLEKMTTDHQTEKKALREKQRLELEQEVSKVRESLQAKLDSEEKLKKREITELVHAHNAKLTELTKTHRETLAAVQERAEKDLAETKARHRLALEDKDKRHESVRVALESERKTQEKLHEKTKTEASKEREKLICELCFEKNTRSQLEEEAVAREKEIKRLRSTINDLNVDLHLLDEKSKKRTQELKEEYEVKHQQAVKTHQESLKKVMQHHAEELLQLEKRLAQMEETHQAKLQLLVQGAHELAGSFERRPSKPQDLSEIDRLKWALAKKEEEARKLSRDLKHCNLELENKEETYTRIFRGNSMSREKRSTPKDDREQLCVDQKLGKEAIFRKSQTADVKYLLKIYNNTKNG